MYQIKWKTNKYGAVPKEYNGRMYHSKKEAQYAYELDLRARAKDIKSWIPQKKIPLDVNGCHICNYYIDFVITHNDGSLEYIEIKGFETEVWRLKWKLFEALYQEDKLTVIK